MNINIEFVFEILLWISFFNPQIFSANINLAYNLLGVLFDIIRFGYLFLFLAKVLHSNSKTGMNKIILCGILCGSTVFLSVFLNSDFNSLKPVIIRYTACIGVMSFVYDKRSDAVSLLKTLFIASEILIYLNAFSMILHPNGLYMLDIYTPGWILGQKQNFIYVYLMALFVLLVACKAKMYGIRPYLLFVVIASTLIYSRPIGLLLTMLATFVLCILPEKWHHLFKTRYFVIIILLFMIGIIYITLNYEKMDFLQQILSLINTDGKMKKNRTILSRVYMWRDAILLWFKYPLFGAGIMSPNRYSELMKYSGYHPVIHNTYLDLICTGGISALLAFIFMNIIAIRRLKTSYHWMSWITIVNLFAMWTLMMVEGMYGPTYALFIFAEYNRQFSEQIDDYNRATWLSRKYKGRQW